MRRRGWPGGWLVAIAVFLTQAGVAVHGGPSLGAQSPSQGELPPIYAAAPGNPHGNSHRTPHASPRAPASPGGGGGGLPRNVFPVAPGNPNGIDAVPTPSPSPSPAGGGGGGRPPTLILNPGGTILIQPPPGTAVASPAPAGSPAP